MLTLVSAPALEPVSVAEAKLHLRQDFSADDDLISSLISAARILCENKTHRGFVPQTWDFTLDHFPGYVSRLGSFQFPYFVGTLAPWEIQLPLATATAVTWIKYVDATGTLTTWDSGNYLFVAGNPGRITPIYGGSYPLSRTQPNAVTVRFVVGYGTVPENVKAAIKLCVAHWYSNREAVAAGSFAEVPLAVDSLLSPEQWGDYR